MMRLITTHVILIFFTCINIYSQSIKGVFKDSNSAPLDLLVVSFVDKDSLTIEQSLTDDLGSFDILIPNGTYTLKAIFLGKLVYTQLIEVNGSIDLGTIIIDNSFHLNEIEVVFKKQIIERKIDRIVFNIENSSSSYGGDAIDALKVTPNVKVEGESISMVGKSSMRVMIDGQMLQYSGEALIAYLKSISSDKIKSIEVITNPPSKYEAEGNSGLINIVLKRAKERTWNSSIRTVYNQYSYPGLNLYENFDIQLKKFTFYNNISYSNGKYNIDENMKTYAEEQLWNQISKATNDYTNISFKIGGEYKIANNWDLGVNYIFNKNKPKTLEKSDLIFSSYLDQKIDSLISTNSTQKNNARNHVINAYTKIKIDSLGKEVELIFDYFNFDHKTGKSLEYLDKTQSLNSLHNNNRQAISTYSTKLDFKLPYDWGTLSFGGKYSYIKTNNNSDIRYNANPEHNLCDKFRYKEKAGALYITLNKSLGEKFELQGGLRSEYTKTEGISFSNEISEKNDYLEFFPTLYLLYSINTDTKFSASYGRRINRPQYNYLNPFKWIHNTHSYTVGNPFLKPSFTNNIEFNFIKGNWHNSVYYSDMKDGYGQITVFEEDVQKTIFDNYFNYKEIGVIETYYLSKLKWLSSSNTFNLSFIKSKSVSSVTDSKISGINCSFSTSNDFYFDKEKRYILNLSYWHYFNGIVDLKKHADISQLDISFKILFLNKNLQISISAYDLFKTNYPLYTRYTNQTKVTYRNYYDIRGGSISLTYKFGGKATGKMKKKAFGEEEEERRLSL